MLQCYMLIGDQCVYRFKHVANLLVEVKTMYVLFKLFFFYLWERLAKVILVWCERHKGLGFRTKCQTLAENMISSYSFRGTR